MPHETAASPNANAALNARGQEAWINSVPGLLLAVLADRAANGNQLIDRDGEHDQLDDQPLPLKQHRPVHGSGAGTRATSGFGMLKGFEAAEEVDEPGRALVDS